MPRFTRRVPALALVALVALLLVTLSASALDVWLSGPSTMWSEDPAAALAAVTQDFTNALGVTTTVSAVVAQVAPLSPAIGAVATVTPPAGMSDADALAALRADALPNANAIASAVSATVRALPVLPTDAVQVTTGKTALSGASFFWETALTELSGQEAALVLPLEVDVQSAVDASEATYLVHILTPSIAANVNDSALFVDYEWWRIDPAGALPGTELTSLLNAAPLTTFNAHLASLAAPSAPLYDYRSLVPPNVRFTRALYVDPDAADDGQTVLPVLSNTTTAVLMYFSGDASGWDTSSLALSDAVAEEATAALKRGSFVNTVTVDAMKYETPSKNTLGGLVVSATVIQGAQNVSVAPWDDSSVVSVLLNGDYTATLALYTGTTPAAVAGASLDKKYGFKCTAGCIGMIVMASVIFFLMIVAAVLIGVMLCCCFDYDKNAETRAVYEDSNDFVAPQAGMYEASTDPYTRPNPLKEAAYV